MRPSDLMPHSTRREFRAMLTPGAALILPGVANALAARVVADCGFSAAYVTGAGIANTLPRHSRQRPRHADRACRPRRSRSARCLPAR